jgi:integrase
MAKLNQPPRSVLVQRYLAYRRSLGYRMHGGELLLNFARFADAKAPNKPLTTSLAIQWASATPSARPKTRAQRLGMVRGFARYCRTFDARTQVPDTSLLGVGFQRGRPHIFAVAELTMILRRARRLETTRSSLHPLTYTTLIGLLASTGMRPGEALRLHWTALDAELCSLRIRRCKFSPERVTAIRTFVRFVIGENGGVNFIGVAQRILAIPKKKSPTRVLGFMTRQEVDAVIAAVNPTTYSGRRDGILFMLLYNSGVRGSLKLYSSGSKM